MTPASHPIACARDAILQTLPEDTSLHGRPGELRFTHVPSSHAKALHPDVQLVVGMRGAGKSFWWAALQSPDHRAFVTSLVPNLRLADGADIAVGFGEKPLPSAYPGSDVLAQLLSEGCDARLIWRTVILHALSGGTPEAVGRDSRWASRVAYVAQNPESADMLLYAKDAELDQAGRHWIILFDALDRSASDWRAMNQLIRGLLQTALDLRAYQRLRVKCFLRTDQLDEREVATFPDASKLLAAMVELTWPPRELYTLLFQYLGNGSDDGFRREVQDRVGKAWQELRVGDQTAWLPPQLLRRVEGRQREILHAITGPWMGRDRRRGYPYTWVPNHLADAQGRTSPRSFLSALRKAAEDTGERYSGHPWPLHYESIKRGVQAASSIRVQELQEDYPWVDALMDPLRGKVVPCEFEEIAKAWDESRALGRLEERVRQQQERLPPAHLVDGADGVRRDLEDLGMFLRLTDGRVNIPDVFRVGYGLGRRGGVRPIRKGEGR